MKITCSVCHSAEAAVFCPADDAAMCKSCDVSVHKGSKHERVAFVSSVKSKLDCDICQAAKAVVCCKEDRAFFCRGCDLAVHSANDLSEKHERFFISGTKLELENAICGPCDDVPCSSTNMPTHSAVGSLEVIPARSNIQASTRGIESVEPQVSKTVAKRAPKRSASINSADDFAVPTMQENLLDNGADFGDFVADLLGCNTAEKVTCKQQPWFDDLFGEVPVDSFDMEVPDYGLVPDISAQNKRRRY